MDKKQKPLEDLDFLVEEARKGLPPCVYGEIRRIEKAYEDIKKYIKDSDYKKNLTNLTS